MYTNKNNLNLLVIDGDQLYAERIVSLLSHYYDKVNLGFMDDKEEFMKSLRHQWDVLLFGQAYDMSFTDVVAILQQENIDLPIIGLMNPETVATGTNKSGLPKVVDSTMIRVLSSDQDAQVVLGIRLQHDAIMARRRIGKLEGILSEAEQRANILIKNSKSAVAYIDQGIHIFANEPYLEMFGYSSIEDVMGVPVIDLIAGGDSVKEFKQFLRRFDKGNRKQVEFKFKSKRTDGSTFEAKLQLAAATYEGEPVSQVIIQQNNANSAEMAKRLAEAQRKDQLTGLDNRLGFEEKLSQVHQIALAGQAVSGLMYMRLDNLGKINANLGLQGVDSSIKQVAHIISGHFVDDYVSRFSDSVFTVLVHNTTEAQFKQTAQDLLDRIANLLIEVGKRTTTTTLSIGMVIMDKQSPDASTVLERAVSSLTQVMADTNNEGNQYCLYDASKFASSDDKVLAEYLAGAFTNNRFKLMYQPIYDISTDSSEFFEVYLRLELSDGSTMRPDQFLPIAKAHNLLSKIDRWLLINACKQLSIVRKTNSQARILIRLSNASLADSQLPQIISQLTKAVGGDAGTVTVQFEEQDLVDYLSVAKKQFIALAKANCGISIHNFGSTTKSLETVAHVKPDIVRLARSYTSDLSDADNLDTIKSLIAKSNDQGIDVLMPYIEEASIMSVSWSVGARYLQGHYLQEPSTEMVVSG